MTEPSSRQKVLPLFLLIPRIFVILGALLIPMHSAWAADKTILLLEWVSAHQCKEMGRNSACLYSEVIAK